VPRAAPNVNGGTRFPHPPARGRVWGGAALEQRDGETGFPQPPARGRVWEGAALAQGNGETGFPHPPTGWEGLGGHSPPKNY